MNSIIYKITCLTNLHVGSGEANFDIIDNTVEKDPITGLPTINSSGVKGALRQCFVEKDVDPTEIFGSSRKDSVEIEVKNEKDKTEEKNKVLKTSPGQVKFYQADLMARPARATRGDKAYYMVTSDDAVEHFKRKMKIFIKQDIVPNAFFCDGISVEGIEPISGIQLLGNKFLVVDDVALRDMPLPVLARNQLDDGISNNLWYEEVVPHKSIFTFAVSSENTNMLDKLAEVIERNPYIQFGGNATIGYGLCSVEEIGRNYVKKEEVSV